MAWGGSVTSGAVLSNCHGSAGSRNHMCAVRIAYGSRADDLHPGQLQWTAHRLQVPIAAAKSGKSMDRSSAPHNDAAPTPANTPATASFAAPVAASQQQFQQLLQNAMSQSQEASKSGGASSSAGNGKASKGAAAGGEMDGRPCGVTVWLSCGAVVTRQRFPECACNLSRYYHARHRTMLLPPKLKPLRCAR